MIDLMIHQGYIKEMKCVGSCSMCPMNPSPTFSKVRMYRLTEKGMELTKTGQKA